MVQPDEVQLHTSPWVSGMSARAYHGPVTAHCRYHGSWEFALTFVMRSLKLQAARRGANHVTTVETHIDPFECRVVMTGVAADLRPLAGG